MPIVRLDDEKGNAWYIDWSTVCDAPKSCAMTREEIRAHMLNEAVREPHNPGPETFHEYVEDRAHWAAKVNRSINRCDRNGVSILDYPQTTGEQYVSCNRAGEGERQITPKELLEGCIAARAAQ